MDQVWESGCKGVIVLWGTFCSCLKFLLCIVPSGMTMNSALYTESVLEPQLIPFWFEALEKYEWMRVQVVKDNSPSIRRDLL